MPIAVTSFGPEGFTDYGRVGLETFCKYWPGKIIAYHESDEPDFKHENLEYVDLFADAELMRVLRWANENSVLRGRMPEGYNYHYDLNKFSRKVFAFSDACLKHGDLVFWLDADTRLLEPVTVEFLASLMAGNYCGVLARKDFHIESGIVGVNSKLPINGRFMRRYRELYTSGQVLQLKGWHDCWAFMCVLNELKPECANWSPGAESGSNALALSPWVGKAVHLKGRKKYSDAA